jgi:hypothetical protein
MAGEGLGRERGMNTSKRISSPMKIRGNHDTPKRQTSPLASGTGKGTAVSEDIGVLPPSGELADVVERAMKRTRGASLAKAAAC